MENKRMEFKTVMENKIGELTTALQAVQTKFDELEAVKATGEETVKGLVEKKASLLESLQLATDLTTAKNLKAQVTDTEEDLELQEALNKGKAVQKASELVELFNSYFAVHAGAKTAFNTLDREYIETMSIRTVEADTELLEGFAREINFSFATATALLIEAGIVAQSDRFYGNIHLGQMSLMTKGHSMKVAMRDTQRELSI